MPFVMNANSGLEKNQTQSVKAVKLKVQFLGYFK